jgi:hypothetical protein
VPKYLTQTCRKFNHLKKVDTCTDKRTRWKPFNTEPETNPLGPYMNIEGDNGEDAGFDVDPDADDEEED